MGLGGGGRAGAGEKRDWMLKGSLEAGLRVFPEAVVNNGGVVVVLGFGFCNGRDLPEPVVKRAGA